MSSRGLDDMALFARLMEHGSFTAAAEHEQVPLATMSRRVAALERRLGVTLLTRTTRRMSLTDAGREYLDYCRRVVAEAEAAEAAVAARQTVPSGMLRVSAPPLLAETLLAAPIAAFVARFPAIRLDLFLADRRVDLAAEGFDAAIRVGGLDEPALVARPLCRIGHTVYASPSYIARRGAPRSEADLADHRRLRFGIGTAVPWHRAGSGGGAQGRPGRDAPALLANSFVLLKALVLAGEGIALLPDFLCRAERETGSLVALPSSAWGYVETVSLVSVQRSAESARLRAFGDLLTTLVAQAVGADQAAPPPRDKAVRRRSAAGA